MADTRLALALALVLTLPVLPLAEGAHQSPASTCVAQIGKDIVLVIDRSSSMLDQGKMNAAQTAANALLGTLSPTLDQSALVSFSSGFSLNKGLSFNHAQTQSAVNALVASGATSLGGAIKLARYELDNGLPAPAPGAPYSGNARAGADRVMIVLSDGDQTIHHANPVSEASYAKSARNITIFSIALGTSISPPGLAAMQAIASSPSHFYQSPSPSQLIGIFQTISAQLNDSAAPGVTLTRPSASHRTYVSDVDVGATEIPGVSIASGLFRPTATASDDCLVDRVEFSLELAGGGAPIALGSDHTSPYQGQMDCDALPAGRHTVVAKAFDWLNKTGTTRRDILCVGAHVDSRATTAYARITNPADPKVETRGARLPPTLPGSDTFDLLTHATGSLLPHELSALHDEANGTIRQPNGKHLHAQSVSRQLNATLASLGLRVDVLETRALAQADADPTLNMMPSPTRFNVWTGSASTPARVSHPAVQAAADSLTNVCVANVVSTLVSVTNCGTSVDLAPGVHARIHETITVSGPGWKEVTVNGLRLLVDRPEARGEIILSQSYAGASFVGANVLRGPWRDLDRESDAGSGADAPPGPLAANALALTPGVYGARVGTANDVDAYAFNAVPGEKLHVAVGASDQTRMTLLSLSPLPNSAATVAPYASSLPGRAPTSTFLPSLTVRLLDPNGVARDVKTMVAGAATAVELNVDMPGAWVVTVQSNGAVADYTMVATRAPAPMTSANDALLGVDAGASCASATLVGPGAHVGTLEENDAADWYRFQLDEGQTFALSLRPGDTLEAADMRLAFYDRACNLVAYGTPLLGSLVKGSPELVTFVVPTGASGLYRAEVAYINGLGTYELVVAPSVAATP